jgi:hypothetical protein
MPDRPKRLPDHDVPMTAVDETIGMEATAALMAGTSEMLGLPVALCGVRRCGRARRCLRVRGIGHLPVCKINLTAEQNEAYFALLGHAFNLYIDAMAGDSATLHHWLNDRDEDWPAAIQITRACLAGNASALACLDKTLALVAESAPPSEAFDTP